MSGGTISTSDTRLDALSLQSSCYGAVIPMCWGLCQVAPNLLWYNGFKAVANTTTQSGKGGAKQKTTTYTYEADVLMGLANGRVSGVSRIWRGKSQYIGGIDPSTLVTVGQDWNTPSSGDMTLTLDHADKFASWGSIVRTYTAPDGATVTIPLQAGSDYTQSKGVVTVTNTALRNMAMHVTYQYTSSTPVTTAMDALGLTLIKGDIGQAPWSGLASYGDQSIGYSGMAMAAGQAYALGNSAQLDNHQFEIIAPWAYHLGPGVPDIDPSLMLRELMTSNQGGGNFPPTSLDSWQSWSDYCVASNLLISPALTEQTALSDIVDLITKLTNSAPVWSGGRLKIIPYGDAPAAANGRTYVPNTTPVYDLYDDSWTPGDDGSPPLTYSRKLDPDCFNQYQIEYLDRSQQYATAVAEYHDLTDVSVNGLLPDAMVQAHWICDGAIATHVAQLLVQRSLSVLTTYKAPLPWHYALLEPMDIVTLTDDELELDHMPVRVIEIEEDEDGCLELTMEDYPPGSASATLYPHQVPQGYQHDYNAVPGDAAAPAIFEVPAAQSLTGLGVYIAVKGGGNAVWGGAQIWVSQDGTQYKQVGVVYGGARYGTLTVDAAAEASTFLVQGLGAAQLLSGTAADAQALNTLCYVGGATPEYFAYTTATLTGAGAYTLSGLVHGAYATPDDVGHAAGSMVVRIDAAVVRSDDLDIGMIGKTIYVKVCSFNIYGGAQQGLDDVEPTAYTITGLMAQGVPGIGGKGISIDATATSFHYPTVGAAIPASITLTAQRLGTLGGVVTWSVPTGTAAIIASGDTCTLASSGMGSDVAVVRASITDNVGTYVRDQTITNVRDGAPGVSAFTLYGDANMSVSGGLATRTGGSAGWNAQVYSRQSYASGATMSMVIQNAGILMAGLNTDPATDASYISLDYAFYLESSGNCIAYESGVSAQNFGPFAVGDVYTLTYNNSSVIYQKNGAVVRTVGAASNLVLYLDSSFYDIGASAYLTFAAAGAVGASGTDGSDGTDGVDAKLLTLSSTALTFNYAASGSPSPAAQEVVLTAALQNVTGDVTWLAVGYDISGVSLGGVTLSGSGLTRVLDVSSFGSCAYAVVTATLGSLSDSVTITRLQQGSVITADKIVQTVSNVTISAVQHVPDFQTFRTNVISVTYEPAKDCTASLTVSGTGSYVAGQSTTSLIGGIYISGTFTNGTTPVDCTAAAAAKFEINGTRSFALTGGTTYVFVYLAAKYDSRDTVTVANLEMRLDVIAVS